MADASTGSVTPDAAASTTGTTSGQATASTPEPSIPAAGTNDARAGNTGVPAIGEGGVLATKKDDGNGGGGANVPASWPGDWREKMAAGDEKVLNRLKRFQSPEAVWKSYGELEGKLSSGQIKRAAPAADASPEDVAAWRKEQGLPEKPEDYLKALPEGLVIGDKDKKMVGDFLSVAHDKNASPESVGAMLDWFYKNQESLAADRREQDLQIQRTGEDELRAEWGPEFRRNVNMVNSYLDEVGSPELKDLIWGGRLGDGTPLGSSPAFLRLMLGAAMEANPAATVVPGAAGIAGKSIDDEIANIEAEMRKPGGGEYYKGPKAQQMQARYRDLIDAKTKLASRG